MSKKQTVFGLIKKTAEFYKDHSDTIKSIATQTGLTRRMERLKGVEKNDFIKKSVDFYREHDDVIKDVAKKMGLKEYLGLFEDTKGVKDDLENIESELIDGKSTKDIVVAEESVGIPNQKIVSLQDFRKSVEEDYTFEQSSENLNKTVCHTISNITNPAEVIGAFNVLVEVARDSIRYAEEQETKREEIRAIRDASIVQINAIKECLNTYLEKSFDERKELFAKQFECVDAAILSGDIEMLSTSLASINSLASSSPFKNLADFTSVQQSLLNPDTEWDI